MPELKKRMIESLKPVVDTDDRMLRIHPIEPTPQIRVQHGTDGSVTLEQLAYSRSAGWYVQKTFRIPADMLSTVSLDLRKASCLHPQCSSKHRLVPNTSLSLKLAD